MSWIKQQPRGIERTIMMKCRNKCFLGKNGKFPICTRKTCRVNKLGVSAAYKRASQYGYHKIAKTAKRMLKKFY